LKKRLQVCSNADVEMCVTPSGLPISREEDGPKQSVLIYGLTPTNQILVVQAPDGGPVDFLVAGHIDYGELPLTAAIREWREEMTSPVPKFEYYGFLSPPVSLSKAYVFVCHVDPDVRCVKSRGIVRPLQTYDCCRNDFYPAVRALSRYFEFNEEVGMSFFLKSYYDKQAQRNWLKSKASTLAGQDFWINYAAKHGVPKMHKQIQVRFKKEFHSETRVASNDLMTKFKIDLRATNQSAQIYTPFEPGTTVILNSDSAVPCPIVSLVYEGWKVGYCVYKRTSGGKRLYYVVECASLNFPELVAQQVRFNVSYVRNYDVELTDTECGANILAQYLDIQYDDAVALIRSQLGFYRISQILKGDG